MKDARHGGIAVIGIVVILSTLSIMTSLSGKAESSATVDKSILSSGTIAYSPTHTLQYVEGDRILNETGVETIWRGSGGSYLFHAGANYQQTWQQHLPELVTMGANTVRLAFAFADSTPNTQTGTPIADILNFTKMDWVLNFLSQHGIKGILDCHNYADMAGDFGSQKLIDDWMKVAEHYSNDPRVEAYELFNEPAPETWAAPIKSRSDVATFYGNLTDAIRQVDPQRIGIWETNPYIPDLSTIQNISRPNVVYTFHRWYTTDEFNIFSPEQLSYMSIAYAVEQRQKNNVPFWFGEFGSLSPYNSSNPEWQLAEQSCWLSEEQVVGWSLWCCGNAVSNAYLPFFPLKVYNPSLTRQPWNPPQPNFTGYVVDSKGADVLELYEIQLWHNGDYVTLKPGITIRFIRNHMLADGTIQTVENNTLTMTGQLTLTNIEGTTDYPGDWNIIMYLIS